MSSAEETPSSTVSATKDIFPECLTLGLIKELEDTPGVQGIEIVRNMPSERMAITSWEQRHSCTLPKDLKNFYLATDGFKLIWNYEYAGEVLPIGNMKINPINELRRIGGFKSQEDTECPTPLDVELCHQQLQRPQLNGTLPNFGTKCKIFELDPCQGLGKVCIVYLQTICTNRTETVRENIGNDQPRIWLLDRCFEWHFIAEDFTTYFRMMLVHKGLPQWQFKFTPIGLTPWAEQMFAMLAPHLLQADLEQSREQDDWDATSDNLLDPAIFKLKSKSTRAERNSSARE